MDSVRVFTGRIQNGKLKVRGWKPLGMRDGEVTVTVERKHAIRSLTANAFYWAAIVAPISDYTGFTPEETHAALKQVCLPKKLAMCDGNGEVHEELVIGGSTRKLTTVDFYEYCERCREFARRTLGMDLPVNREAA